MEGLFACWVLGWAFVGWVLDWAFAGWVLDCAGWVLDCAGWVRAWLDGELRALPVDFAGALLAALAGFFNGISTPQSSSSTRAGGGTLSRPGR
ncbi:MAG TPA: hypothetical protein VFZ97_07175 [Acidimicrobiales bacterium]